MGVPRDLLATGCAGSAPVLIGIMDAVSNRAHDPLATKDPLALADLMPRPLHIVDPVCCGHVDQSTPLPMGPMAPSDGVAHSHIGY